MRDYKVVLLGAVGLSPAVLTETVWALAQENPPVIPDEVVVITTADARKILHESLCGEAAGWDALRTKLKVDEKQLSFCSSASIQVIGDGFHDLKDISSMEQNECAADCILKVIRQYSEDPKTRIIASIAGGRKTMSALMLSCMSLLGREQDRVCHVLANDAFVFSNPNFLFPKNKTEEKAAQIQLSDIPFVRVRGLYEKELGEAPSSYSSLVDLFHGAAPPAINFPKITVYETNGKVYANNEDLHLSPKEFLLTQILAKCFLKQKKPFANWSEVTFEIEEEMKREHPLSAIWHEKMLDIDYRKARWSAVASDIRKKRLNDAPWASALILSPGTPPTYPPGLITVRATRKSPPRKSPPRKSSAQISADVRKPKKLKTPM